MNRRRLIGIVVIIALLGLAFGNWLGQPLVLCAVIGLIGLFVIYLGLKAIVTREMHWTDEDDGEFYQMRGMAAVANGLLFLFAGLAAVAVSVLGFLHPEQSLAELIRSLLSRPGIVLPAVGLLLAVNGLAGVVGAHAGCVRRAIGVVFLVVAALLVGLGVMDLLASGTAAGLWAGWWPRLVRAFGGG